MNALLKALHCWRNGHQYRYIETLSPHCVRLGCECCRHEIAYNAAARLEAPWKKVSTWYDDNGYLHPDRARDRLLIGTDNPMDPETDRFCNHRME